MREVAVDPEADANEIEACLGEPQRTGGVRRVQERARGEAWPDRTDGGVERRELPPRELARLVGVMVGHREVRPHAADGDVAVGEDREHGAEVDRRDALAVHPGVELHVHRRHVADAGGGRGKLARGAQGADREGEPRHERVAQRDRLRLGEEQDRRRHAVLAQLDALVDERDAQHRRAAGEQGVRHHPRAVAVAVGLHDRAQP